MTHPSDSTPPSVTAPADTAAGAAHPAYRILDPEQFYHSGPTTFFASQRDQRFSYCLYVPTAHRTATAPLPLVTLVHGTQRNVERYRNEFRQFAEEHSCVVLAPLFPAGIGRAGDLHGFKKIEAHGVRYDQVLLDIVAEVGENYQVDTARMLLHGFSGGGQFVHRFAYLHPDRLAAVSIGAPGRVTRISDDIPWWLGTADLAERFGTPLALPELRDTQVLMVVGANDVETWEIAEPGLDAGGETRVERLTALHDNFTRHGIGARLEIVPGVAHNGVAVMPIVQRFFSDVLHGART